MGLIKSTSTLDRIHNIVFSLRGAMVPAQIIFSPETYQEIINQQNVRHAINAKVDVRQMLERHLSMPVAIREENSDVIITKELYPNPCPIRGCRIPFIREIIDRLETHPTRRIRCPRGHRFEGEIKTYYLNIRPQSNPLKSKARPTCPQCGSQNIQNLSQMDLFCLDCEWDNLHQI